MDPGVQIAVVTAFSAIAVAWVTNGRRTKTVASTAARAEARAVTAEECKGHLDLINAQAEEIKELRDREDDCQALVTLLMVRLTNLERRSTSKEIGPNL